MKHHVLLAALLACCHLVCGSEGVRDGGAAARDDNTDGRRGLEDLKAAQPEVTVRRQSGNDDIVFVDSGSGADGGLKLVYAWKQLTYDIDGRLLLEDQDGAPPRDTGGRDRGKRQIWNDEIVFRDSRADSGDAVPDSEKFFIQYNNVPMGVERWHNKLFVTVPRRRHGIPSTLNYLELDRDGGRSPSLRPYPPRRSPHPGPQLVSVYRTRVDECDRLWMVDTGLLEIPNARLQKSPPSIVVYDLKTDRLLLRYNLKPSDLFSERTPAGLASITVDVARGACDAAYAYVPDLATYGLIVFSLRDNDSWRVSHNFFSFSPIAGNLNIAGQQFSWNDGIFSVTLGAREAGGARTAYFHPMVSFQEFSVSTRVLRDRALATRDFHGDDFKLVGERGNLSQSTMHGYHAGSGAILYAEVGRDALACWNTRRRLTPDNKVVLKQDHREMVYPSDLHVSGDEVWLMSNTMPRFIYSSLDPGEYNFRVYRGNIGELIAGTKCAPPRPTEGPSYVQCSTEHANIRHSLD